MTPVEIIGLVSAVITFIDFAAENVAVAREIQKSGSAAVKGNEDLERRIKLFDDQIASLHRTTPGATRDVHEAQLLKLLDEYKDLTVNLLSLLGGLKSTKKRHVLWKSAKNFLRKDEKESLVQDLENCRTRIHLQLTQVMRHDLGRRLDNISDQGEQQIAELKTLRQSTEALETKMKSWEHMPDVLDEVRSLVAQVNGALSRKAQRRILESLWVEGMVDRFEEVEEAHEATFEWIVDHDQLLEDETPEESAARQQMVDWLTRGHGIFHITGKPGAGKSTLMKFLCQSPKTLDYLNTWSGEKSLVISNFFFWRLGTKVQKSLEGLRRSLLYSILEKLPDLIPTVLPELWKSTFDDRVMKVRANDVDTALERLLSQGNFLSSHRLVFFIDGLDEFDGDHDKMMKQGVGDIYTKTGILSEYKTP
ncbi:hypothetical protein CkaCkLH20_06581 [Colletotrichum karsti]|uniref:Nephrocystin 3-like N-terminal domain-containing protein n=1 Tax=Colletotrichum karsti TaxID=1095194 RepID=A0A9P6LKK2_9PEZI|nr:uncharacterized protein CkaCkLH20_06581 [Colletotrichum karsti]KAF9876135.1 hypothetical protein CkaCkLH20_06581 [Colletotrichum karsti]